MSSIPNNNRIVIAALAGIGLAGIALVAYTLLTRKNEVGKETTKKNQNQDFSPSSNLPNFQPTSAFGSIDKTDKKIVEQIRNRNFQLPLASHDWPFLIPLGPDFVALGDSMWRHWSENEETAENVSREVLWKYVEPVLRAQNLERWLYQFLDANPEILFEAIKEIAESYLARAPEGTKEKNPAVPLISLMGTNPGNQPSGSFTTYTPKRYLTSGNASKVWLGLMPLENGTEREIVLKQINETQKDSAIIEYNIAQKILFESGEENSRTLMHYMDLINESPSRIWLVLEKIRGTEYGMDLTEYLSNGFFQAPGDPFRSHARHIACDLLLGLRHIAFRRVILRDLKADNVLIHYDPITDTYQAKWTDFGLAVDLDAIRRPTEGSSLEQVKVGLVGFWYDTQKLVPRPKWVRRRPPENCFKICVKNLASYDIYMLGVVFCSVATGIDWAHIEKKEILQKAETLFGAGFAGKTENDVLKWDIGKAINGPLRSIVLECFKNSFGTKFGEKLFEHTLGMLEEDWNKRPTPQQVLDDVFRFHT